MTKNNYNIEKIIDSLNNKNHTNFITRKELNQVTCRLNKNSYEIYELYPESNKVILYKKELPDIKLYKIECKNNLRHQDILGAIFSMQVSEDSFGDIIKHDNNFYLFLLPHLENDFKCNLTNIRDYKIELIEEDLSYANNFKQEYKLEEYIVSSLRIDNIVSTITHESRNEVLYHFKNKEIILNYEENIKPTRIIHENDVFSIRKYGKYRYLGIIKTTKKGGFIISIEKFI